MLHETERELTPEELAVRRHAAEVWHLKNRQGATLELAAATKRIIWQDFIDRCRQPQRSSD